MLIQSSAAELCKQASPCLLPWLLEQRPQPALRLDEEEPALPWALQALGRPKCDLHSSEDQYSTTYTKQLLLGVTTSVVLLQMLLLLLLLLLQSHSGCDQARAAVARSAALDQS